MSRPDPGTDLGGEVARVEVAFIAPCLGDRRAGDAAEDRRIPARRAAPALDEAVGLPSGRSSRLVEPAGSNSAADAGYANSALGSDVDVPGSRQDHVETHDRAVIASRHVEDHVVGQAHLAEKVASHPYPGLNRLDSRHEHQSARARGDTSLGQLQADLSRVRAWAGLLPVSGPGIQVTIAGQIPGTAVQDLLNELRNAGAESFAVDGVRVVSGSVVAGPAGALSIEDTPLGASFEVDAIGNAATLTGSLTRAGGIVARLKATFPGVQLTVTPVSRLELPATTRTLVPSHGRPRL